MQTLKEISQQSTNERLTDIIAYERLNYTLKALAFEMMQRKTPINEIKKILRISTTTVTTIRKSQSLSDEKLKGIDVTELFKSATQTRRELDALNVKMRSQKYKPADQKHSRVCPKCQKAVTRHSPYHRSGRYSYHGECWELLLF